MSIAVLGAGSWGTALAILLAHNKKHARLWGNNPKAMQAMQSEQVNTRYLSGIKLPNNLQIEVDLAAALKGAHDVLIAVPSNAFIDILKNIKPLLEKNARVMWATKGLDHDQHRLLHEAMEEILGSDEQYAILSGPSFAMEVARGLPTAVTLAATDAKLAEELAASFRSAHFRVYPTNDVVGVEICGAVKNVLAIATGISDGLGYGANARCALIARGLHEMTRLGLQLGAKEQTFMGLAGVGDLVLTCTDNQSRNRRFGLALGEGKGAIAAEKEINQAIEGKYNAVSVHYLAQRYCVEMPICEQVYRVLINETTPRAAVENLLSRAPRAEGI